MSKPPSTGTVPMSLSLATSTIGYIFHPNLKILLYTAYGYGSTCDNLRVTAYGFRLAVCELQLTAYDFRLAVCELQLMVKVYGSTCDNLRVTAYGFFPFYKTSTCDNFFQFSGSAYMSTGVFKGGSNFNGFLIRGSVCELRPLFRFYETSTCSLRVTAYG